VDPQAHRIGLAVKRPSLRLSSLAIGLTIGLLLAEQCSRFVLDEAALLPAHYDERNLAYRFDETLGWMSVENKEGWYTDTRRVFFKNNAEGFRDSPHSSKEKTRIAFLGDSFVWGYDVQQEERFTEQLQQLMPAQEILNLGISGYGTDQEYLLLRRFFDPYAPDVVVLVVLPANDREDNSTNLRYEGYYKPYFVMNDGRLQAKGIPVPRSPNYYRLQWPLLFRSHFFSAGLGLYFRTIQPEIHNPDPTLSLLAAMRDFLQSRGARFMIGLIDGDPEIEAFCRAAKIDCLNLENSFRDPANGGHWTAPGHSAVCRVLYPRLAEAAAARE
jgi:hypothetical protein